MVAIECLEECPVINTPLAQLSELFPDLPSTVVGIARNGKLFIPHSADQLIAGDLAYVVTTKDQVRRTLGLFGHEELEATRIVIAGGGNIGLHVARTLEQRQTRTRVKIIEHTRERAVSVADELRRTVVLQGSALDQKLLMEAEIQDADLFPGNPDGDDVVCFVKDPDGEESVVRDELIDAGGGVWSFEIGVTAEQIVTCSVYNSFDYEPAITLTKVNAPTVVRADLSPALREVTSTYVATNNGNTPLANLVLTDDDGDRAPEQQQQAAEGGQDDGKEGAHGAPRVQTRTNRTGR